MGFTTIASYLKILFEFTLLFLNARAKLFPGKTDFALCLHRAFFSAVRHTVFYSEASLWSETLPHGLLLHEQGGWGLDLSPGCRRIATGKRLSSLPTCGTDTVQWFLMRMESS